MKAQLQWMEQLQSTEVIIFAIVGSVPFQLTFDVPVLAG
jgi:hypothetical protein